MNNEQIGFLVGMVFGGLAIILGYKYKEWKLRKKIK